MALSTTGAVIDTAEDAQAEQPAMPEQFRITDDASANWVVRKIVEARAYAKRCAEWCAREQSRAQRDEEFLLFHFGPQLADHARRRIGEQGGRRRSVNLPAGLIGFRQERPKLLIDDESVVIKWAKQHKPELVITVERLSKSAFNQHVEETGEVPDFGVHVEPARENFYVR